MATTSDTATGGGLVTGTDWWFLMSTALGKSLVYESTIVCDGVKQPKGNPVTGPPVAGPPVPGVPAPKPGAPWTKFSPAGALGISGWGWPNFRNVFVGPKGSKGSTNAGGSSTVTPGTFSTSYDVTMNALATATAAAGGVAQAISTIKDPWRFVFPATGNPKKHNVIAIVIGLRGSLRRVRLSSGIALSGDIGRISVSLDGQTGKLKVLVRLNAGWRAYPGVRFGKKTRRIRPPKAVKPNDLKRFLEKSYNRKTMSLGSQKRLGIAFMKDVGAGAGSYDVGIDVSALEQDEIG
jgi:hypothetical protein